MLSLKSLFQPKLYFYRYPKKACIEKINLIERVGPTELRGFGPGLPMGQKIFTGRVTARVKNRVKHTFF
jgi:hypothetical protein